MTLRKKLLSAVSVFMMTTALLSGCQAQTTNNPSNNETVGTELKDTGILILSVNPEIQIEYDKDGKVLNLIGKNEDGKTIVAEYQDYIGKDCETVINDLIVKINEAGYFVDDIDGNKKNIILQIEPGSVLPNDHFLTDMSTSTQEAVKNLSLTSGIVTIDSDDYDAAYAKNGQPSPYITLEKAHEIALTQANVNAADVVFDDREFDHDDGVAVFELEFAANGVEYEYDIDAVTGKVLKAQHHSIDNYNDTDYGPNNNGITDYNDTDYGPNNDGVTDYNDTDYGPNNDGITDYNDTDYGPNNDGITDYNDTDYGPNNDGITDYNDTDYGPNNDGITDYNDGVTDYNDSNYGDRHYD